MRRKHFLLLSAIIAVSAAIVFAFLGESRNQSDAVLPEARPYSGGVTEPTLLPIAETNPPSGRTPTATPSPPPLPPPSSQPAAVAAETNLAIPFTSQAPHANWDLPYQEFCEEASVLMAAHYIHGQTIAGPDDADRKMLAIKAFEEQRFGDYKDTTAEETAVILREYYGISAVEVVEDPTVAMIRQAVSQGRAVLVPAAGRELGNPNFRQPGPLYHMLVVKGYTKDGRFITNDPGTRRGADFLYDPNVLLNAVHDWNGGNVSEGRKVMIVVG